MAYLTKKQRQREAARFDKVRRAEGYYASQLRKIARNVGDLIKAYPAGESTVIPELISVLSRYADIIRPWARATAARMIAEVARRDATAWFKHSEQIGLDLRREIRETPIGDEVRRILDEQVALITSIPIEAGRRVQLLTQEYAASGRRAVELVPMVQRSGVVAVSRANIISRTEVARTASAITTARARYIGATHGIWHTARDRDVRPLHKKLEGKVFALDDPPVIGENGERGLPGTIYNCRCWLEPILPTVIK